MRKAALELHFLHKKDIKPFTFKLVHLFHFKFITFLEFLNIISTCYTTARPRSLMRSETCMHMSVVTQNFPSLCESQGVIPLVGSHGVSSTVSVAVGEVAPPSGVNDSDRCGQLL